MKIRDLFSCQGVGRTLRVSRCIKRITAPPEASPYLCMPTQTTGRILQATFLAIIFSFSFSGYAAYDMSRYEVIMERQPFGKEPLMEEIPVVQSSGTFAKQYRLCMLYTDAQGQLKAGLVSKTNNKNFFLQVGESDAGLDLVDVRLEDGVAIVRQGNETAELILEGLGTPLAISVSQQVAMNPASAGLTPTQMIRRGGADSVPEHILATLADSVENSAPKQAKITVRKTTPVVSPGASTGLSSESGLPESLNSSVNRPEDSSEKANGEVAQARVLSNYAVQSVPLHLQKKLLAKGF